MRTILFLSFLLLFTFSISKAQQYRYFEFTAKDCGYGNWQDSVFVAAASNQSLIDTVLAEINKPMAERRFINGPIDYGNGGFNYNAGHSFLWHHIPDQWMLVDAAIEVCDGCPYSGVDSNLIYFVDTIGHFCPWVGHPLREISKPTPIENDLNNKIKIYPNPSHDLAVIEYLQEQEYKLEIFSLQSSKPIVKKEVIGKYQLNTSKLKKGVYLIYISTQDSFATKKLIVI